MMTEMGEEDKLDLSIQKLPLGQKKRDIMKLPHL